MRQIKFRAWSKNLKEMCKVHSMDIFKIPKHIELVVNPSGEEDGDLSTSSFDDVIVMQFTGIKDKNEKEIFEGDILKIHDLKGVTNDFIAQICWSEKELSWAFKERLHWQRPTESMWAWILDKELEVIGNIYENPQLLEGKK